MLHNADGGGGGCQIFNKKALRRCKVQRYLARGGGCGFNFQEKTLHMATCQHF